MAVVVAIVRVMAKSRLNLFTATFVTRALAFSCSFGSRRELVFVIIQVFAKLDIWAKINFVKPLVFYSFY